MGYKQWADGDLLTPTEVDDYMLRQAVLRFADAAARTSQLASPVAGMRSYLADTRLEYIYQAGGDWVPLLQGIKKTAQEDITTNATPQDDDHLQVQLEEGTYRVELFMHASGPQAGDVQTQWVFSGTIGDQARSCFGPALTTTHVPATAAAATTVGTTRASAHTITAPVSYGCDGSNTGAIHEDLWVQVTAAGLLKLQWAQNASSGTTSSTIGSRMYVTRLK